MFMRRHNKKLRRDKIDSNLTVLNSRAVNKTISPQLPQNKMKKTFHLRVTKILFEISATFEDFFMNTESVNAIRITNKIIPKMNNDCQKFTRKLDET